ncbi:MAG: LCP family protein [Candidatus Merdivicinus sp.]|jgi:LCP family protein required for cell wall assembly
MATKKTPKKRLRTGDKILLALSIVLIGVSLGIIGYVSLLNWASLPEVDEEGNAASISDDYKTEEENQKKVVNFLVTGIDYAEGTGRAKLTDVIMVVSYNLEEQNLNILQIPRDTYIGSEYPTGKINAVYGNANAGGVENLARVIYDRFRLPIDHYVTITMDGFVNAIDAIGGVEINVQESFTLEGVTIRPGVQTLNGTQAEKFVRERHSRGGDIGRINAQREFLSALVKKFKNLSMGQITALAPTLMNEVTTDLTVNDVLTLAPQVLKLDTSNMAFHMVPGEGAYANNLSVWGVHKQVLADLLNEYFRPFSDPVPAEELNILEIANTTDYYDDNDTTVGDLIGGGTSSGTSGN